jgi:hypothetical protein
LEELLHFLRRHVPEIGPVAIIILRQAAVDSQTQRGGCSGHRQPSVYSHNVLLFLLDFFVVSTPPRLATPRASIRPMHDPCQREKPLIFAAFRAFYAQNLLALFLPIRANIARP